METMEGGPVRGTQTNRAQFLPLSPQCERKLGTYWQSTPGFVKELAAYLEGRKVLEIFAGNGYLAGYLAARGIDVTATTIFSSHDAHGKGLYYPVQSLSASDAVREFGASHDVLLVCWPTATPAVLSAALQWGAEKPIVFIGEITDYTTGMLGGCATDEFFEHLRITERFSSYVTRKSFEHAVVGYIASSPVTSIGR